MGFQGAASHHREQAVIVLDGVIDTTLRFRTSTADLDTQETSIRLPKGVTTASTNRYDIALNATSATLRINGLVAAVHRNSLPSPYTVMDLFARSELIQRSFLENTVIPDSVFLLTDMQWNQSLTIELEDLGHEPLVDPRLLPSFGTSVNLEHDPHKTGIVDEVHLSSWERLLDE